MAAETPGQAQPATDVGTDSLDNRELPGISAWDVTSEKSPIDDSPKVSAMLLPARASGTGIGNADIAIVLRCAENTTSVVVLTSMFMTSDRVAVTTRIGDAPATTSNWDRSTNYKAVGLWSGGQAIPFIRSLKDDARLVVRVQESDRIDAEFNLGNVSEVVQQLSTACGWTP